MCKNFNEVIEKLDYILSSEDYDGAKAHLIKYENIYENEQDLAMLLSIQSEIIGLARKINDVSWGMDSISKALMLIEHFGNPKTVEIATILLNTATTLKAFNRPNDALKYYATVEDIYNEKLPTYHVLFSALYNNMSLALMDVERYQEAEEKLLHALDIVQKYESKKIDVALTYTNMGDLYAKWLGGDSAKVKECMDKGFEIFNDTSIPRDGYFAFCCRKTAPAFGFHGYFMAKKLLNEWADEIYEGH